MASQSTASALPAPSAAYVVLISSAAALGGFLFGFDTAVVNGTIVALQNAFNASSAGVGLSVSLALLASAVGAFAAGPFADRQGRIRTMLLAALAFLVSAIGSGIAVGVWDFIFWRSLGGIAVGAASVVAPAYIAEVAPARMRGRLGSLQQLAIVVGIFTALLSNYLIGRASDSAEAPFWFGMPSWRWMFWIEALPAALYGLSALLIPESPRFLVSRGREAEAAAVLARVERGDVSAKVQEIRRTVNREYRPRLSDLRGNRLGLLPIVWIGIGLSVLQQLVGINVIFYYSTVLWRSIGFTEENALLISTITGITNIVTTLIAIAFVDRFGRKPLLLLGSLGMTLTLGTMAFLFGSAPVDAAGNPTLTDAGGLVALAAANAFVFFFGFSWGPVVWVLLGEMFSNRIRGIALAVSAAAQWVANFGVSLSFPVLTERFGLGLSYGLYTGAAALSLVFVAYLVRETKGKELEEMQDQPPGASAATAA